MVDSAAALLDERLRPPRQGDDDEGRALLLDAPAPNRWPSLLALGEAFFGRLDWWPPVDAGREQLDPAVPWPPRNRTSRAGPRSGRRDSPTPGSPCCARTGSRTRRSGAGATGARTATSASPRTPMPTPCPWRSATEASMSSPIQAPTATTASLSGGRTSARRSRTTPSSLTGRASPATAAPSSGCGMRSAREIDVHDIGEVAELDRGARRLRCRSTRRPGTVARSGWTGPRAPSTSSTRSRRQPRRPPCLPPRPRRAGGTRRGQRDPALARRGHAGGGTAGTAAASCGGACTEVRPTPSSAGTPAAWDGAFPPSRCSAAAARRPMNPSPRGWSFSTSARRQNLPLPSQPYHGPRPIPRWERRGDATRRPDERPAAGSAQVPAASAATQDRRRHFRCAGPRGGHRAHHAARRQC